MSKFMRSSVHAGLARQGTKASPVEAPA